MSGRREGRYAVGSKAATRLTAARTPPAVSPVLKDRIAAKLARRRAGPSLAQQLHAPPAANHRPTAGVVVGSVLTAGGGTAIFLGWLQSSWPAAIGGAATAAAGAWCIWRWWARGASDPQQPVAAPMVDDEAILAFDNAFARLAPQLPDDVAQALARCKAQVVRIARSPAAAQTGERFGFEDRMFVRECVRRYLPDALQAYLLVPAAQRHAQPADGESAHELLLSQLQRLAEGLAERESKLAADAREALLREQRFLQAKGRSG